MEFINLPLIKNPLNWFTVFMMIVIAMIGFHFVVKLFEGGGSAANVSNPLSNNTGAT
jgi:hypothetical protein